MGVSALKKWGGGGGGGGGGEAMLCRTIPSKLAKKLQYIIWFAKL